MLKDNTMTSQDAAKRASEQECWKAEEWLAGVRFADSRAHSATDIAKLIADYAHAAVAEAVSHTKADAIALCASEFERGLLSGRAEVAEARREEREKYKRIGDWRLGKALEHMDRLRTFARTKDDHDFLDRYTGWLLMVQELTADLRPPASAPDEFDNYPKAGSRRDIGRKVPSAPEGTGGEK